MNPAKASARPTRKSAEMPTRPTKENMVKTLTHPMMPKSEETKTSLTTMNPAKKSHYPMAVNDAKTSTRPMMTNIAKISNRPTAMESVTTSTRPMPTTKAAKMSTRLMFPPPRAASSTRLPHPLLRLSHRHLPHVSPVLLWNPEHEVEAGKDKKNLSDCLIPMDSRGMYNVGYTLSGQSANGCAVFKTMGMNTTTRTNERG
ncbi:hypothetical protein V8E52_005706 [Russula decolorans]|jgi:hypothetical protein